MATDARIEELTKQTRAKLIQQAERIGVTVKERWNKSRIAKEIIRAEQIAEAVAAVPSAPATPSIQRPDNPEFERLAATPIGAGPADDLRGGQRPGAGRPNGSTEDKTRARDCLKNEVPDPTIKFALELIFGAWQSAVDVPGIALTEPEAGALALPTTNLLNYYFPNLKVSPVLEAWLGLAIVGKVIIGGRIALIRAAAEAENGERDKAEELHDSPEPETGVTGQQRGKNAGKTTA